MKNFICILSTVLFFNAAQMSGQTKNEKVLTLSDCVAIALANHPSVKVSQSAVDAAEATLTQTRSMFLPQINFNFNVVKNGGTFLIGPIAREQDFKTYQTGFQLQQTIFDFGRSIYRTSSSSSAVDAAEYDHQGSTQNVVLDVQVAYFSYLQSERIVKVNEDAYRQAEEHLLQAKAFYSVGKRPLFDVTKAEVDLANANVNLIKARNQLRISKVQLDHAMGLENAGSYVLKDNLDFVPIDVKLEEGLKTAMITRPEVLSANSRVDASNAAVKAAWTQHLPSVSLVGGYNWRGFDFPLSRSWNYGLVVSVPIFQGFSLNAGVDQARASLETAKANFELAKQAMSQDVEQQYLSLKEAEERIKATEKLVEQAKENLSLAEARYNSGVGSAIEITDAQVTLANAKITNIQALYDYKVSTARLQRAIGTIH